MYRLFISINLSPEHLDLLIKTQDQLKRDLAQYPLRWTRPEGMHLTLKFLGNTEPARVDSIQQALAVITSAHQPFDITIGGLGCFPNPGNPRVLWTGVHDPEGQLRALAASVDEAMAACSFARESRPFSGHLTLARVQRYATKEERRHLGEHLSSAEFPDDMATLSVHSIHLMRSDLQPQGAIYTSLTRLKIGD